MSPLYTVFHPRNMNEIFLEFFFKTNKWHKFMEYNGDSGARSDRFSIKTELFYAMTIPFPSHKEQNKIGMCLKTIDHLITLHQSKSFGHILKVIVSCTLSWEQRKLGEIGMIITGSTPSTSLKYYYTDDSDEGIVWVTPTDIINNITVESEKRLTSLGQKVAHIVPQNTILVTCIASIGKNTMLIDRGSFNQQINGLIPYKNKYEPYFLLTESFIWSNKMKSSAPAGTMQIVNRKEFSEIDADIPNKSEQNSVGSFFRTLDSLITLHQRKLEKLKIIKKSMLENLFPQNGEKTPKIRFLGFTKDWEQRKFSEIALRESNLRLSSSDFPCVEYEDVVSEAGILNNDIRSKKVVKAGIMFDDTHVLYGKLRPYLHNWLCPDFSGVAVGDWWVLKPCYVVREFIYRIVQTKRFDNATNQSSGSKMPRADWNLVSNTEFMIPSDSSEQEKIGLYFKKIDHLITLHQSKLEKLQKIKKSMLENMFV